MYCITTTVNTLLAGAVLAAALSAQVVVTPTSPYFENFEAGPGAWTANNLWQRGTPTKGAFLPAPSGTAVFITSLSANYPNNANAQLSATFDFTALQFSPLIRFKLRVDTEEEFDGLRLEVDDGTGFVEVGFTINQELNWYNGEDEFGIAWTGLQTTYLTRVHRLEGTAGKNITLRFVFRSDDSVTDQGVAIDDVEIFSDLTPALVTDTLSYSDDFEMGQGFLSTYGTEWQFGQVQDLSVSSGVNAWTTRLTSNYLADRISSLELPVDATMLSKDAALSFRINLEVEETFDGMVVEIDTGNGYDIVGSLGEGINWYNSNFIESLNSEAFTGDSGFPFRALIRLPGTAGTRFVVRFTFGADNDVQFAGVVIDDILVESSSPFPGTNDDLDLISALNFNFEGEFGGSTSTDVHDVIAGDFVSLKLRSPQGTAVGLQYVFFATPFNPSNQVVPEVVFPPSLVAMFPALSPSRLYANLAGPDQSIIIYGNGDFGLGIPPVLPSAGLNLTFQWPPSFAGRAFQFQGAVMDTNAVNGMFRSSNAQIIRN